MAASMQAPPTRPRDDYRAFDEEERRFSGRDQSTSFAAGPFRPRQYIPEHSATLSHPAGPAYLPMHRGYEVSFISFSSCGLKSLSTGFLMLAALLPGRESVWSRGVWVATPASVFSTTRPGVERSSPHLWLPSAFLRVS